MTARAYIAVTTGGFGGYCRKPTIGGSITSSNANTEKLIAVEQNILNIIIQNPVKQIIGGACDAPSVFFGAVND